MDLPDSEDGDDGQNTDPTPTPADQNDDTSAPTNDTDTITDTNSDTVTTPPLNPYTEPPKPSIFSMDPRQWDYETRNTAAFGHLHRLVDDHITDMGEQPDKQTMDHFANTLLGTWGTTGVDDLSAIQPQQPNPIPDPIPAPAPPAQAAPLQNSPPPPVVAQAPTIPAVPAQNTPSPKQKKGTFDPTPVKPPLPEYPKSMLVPPGEGFVWEGRPGTLPGDKRGSWVNRQIRQLRDDSDHPPPKKPHIDFQPKNVSPEYPNKKGYRWFPDGTMEPKA